MKKIIPLLGVLLLASCSTVDIKDKPVDFKPATVPDPRPLSLSSTQWKVYNANDIKNLSKSLSGQKAKTFLLFGLDNQNFNNMDGNIQDMMRYILEMKTTKDFYKNLEVQENAPQKK